MKHRKIYEYSLDNVIIRDEPNMKYIPVKLTKKKKVAQLESAIKSDIQWGLYGK